MIDAAQRAAAAGDYAAAEQWLRDAVDRQEATLGSSHPDLATTLNNLAFVCERTGKFDEAERGYRRAHKIAVASLSPGHPFIKTSLSNLVDFCEARGIPLWTKPETPIEDEPLPDDDVDAASPNNGDDASPKSDASPEIAAVWLPAADVPAATRRLPVRMIAVAAVVVAAIVVIVFARQGRGDAPRVVAQPPAEPAASSTPVVPKRSTSAPPAAPEPPTVKPAPRVETSTASVMVLKAEVCRELERRGSPDWQCTPAAGDGPPGTYTFYTRLRTTSETTVEHRWSRDGRVHQTMRLRVSPSSGSGFRTFSVTTVSPERAGEWKVELRAADGALLDEKSFRVR
jgi:hypothetical protein